MIAFVGEIILCQECQIGACLRQGSIAEAPLTLVVPEIISQDFSRDLPLTIEEVEMWSPSDCIRLGGEYLHQARIVEKRIALIACIRALGRRFRLGGSGRSLRP